MLQSLLRVEARLESLSNQQQSQKSETTRGVPQTAASTTTARTPPVKKRSNSTSHALKCQSHSDSDKETTKSAKNVNLSSKKKCFTTFLDATTSTDLPTITKINELSGKLQPNENSAQNTNHADT